MNILKRLRDADPELIRHSRLLSFQRKVLMEAERQEREGDGFA